MKVIIDTSPVIQSVSAPWSELWTFESLDSTQSEAARRLESGEDLRGVVSRAIRQTGGRGRDFRRWESPAGGLYLTAVAPAIWTGEQQYLGWVPLCAAVACANAIETRWSLGPLIKWPNDVLLTDCKLAGVLGEVRFNADRRPVLVIGLGLNWSVAPCSAPGAPSFHSTALGEYIPELTAEPMHDFIGDWLQCLAQWIEGLMTHPGETEDRLIESVHPRLWRRDRQVTLDHTAEGRVSGYLRGLCAGGGALIEVEKGRTIEIHSGEQADEQFIDNPNQHQETRRI